MDMNLFCNMDDCHLPVTDTGWVTRCLHVFCKEHGDSVFANKHSRVECPICSEENIKETDVLLCDANQSDMCLGGLTPDKCLNLLAKSIKLWKYQLSAEKKFDLIRYQQLLNKLEETKRQCDGLLKEANITHSNKMAVLNTNYQELRANFKQVTSELEMAKLALKQRQSPREREKPHFPPSSMLFSDLPGSRNNFSPSHRKTGSGFVMPNDFDLF